MAFDVANHQGFRPEVIDRDVEETLDLTRMQIHSDDMIASSDDEHVGDELGSDGRTRLVLFVHTCIWEARDDGGDPSCRGGLAGRDKDEELHEVVVDVVAARLDDEDILVSHRLGDLDVDLTVGELFDGDGDERNVKPV